MMILAAFFKYDYIAMVWLVFAVLSILDPVLVMLDSCTWKTVFKTWGLLILLTIIWIWAMQVGIVPDSIEPE
jgi:hypothetical protein